MGTMNVTLLLFMMMILIYQVSVQWEDDTVDIDTTEGLVMLTHGSPRRKLARRQSTVFCETAL